MRDAVPGETVGLLEFVDNAFIRSVAAGLPDVPTAFIRTGELPHPSPAPYRLVVDRVSYCDPFLQHVMRYWSHGGTYVLNNPFFTRVYDKLSELYLLDRLSIRHPATILLPRVNLTEDVREIVAQPQWGSIGDRVGFPCILKPVDGYAWQDVFTVEDMATLRGIHESFKDSRTFIVQELIRYESYYRAFCINRSDVFIARWNPMPYDMGEYSLAVPRELDGIEARIRSKTVELNVALGLDFNAVEWCVTRDGTLHVIDAHNDVPDVRPEKLPPECYAWIVERFCACIREKLASGERNAIPPDAWRGSEPGALPG
jgi:hypothetical protein